MAVFSCLKKLAHQIQIDICNYCTAFKGGGELLGHSKVTVTQEHYAKVVKSKVSDEINNLKNSLK